MNNRSVNEQHVAWGTLQLQKCQTLAYWVVLSLCDHVTQFLVVPSSYDHVTLFLGGVALVLRGHLVVLNRKCASSHDLNEDHLRSADRTGVSCSFV